MNILLIEDDEETAEYIRRGLGEDGHAVALAADGQAGLLAASDGNWDLLIVDRKVPKLDGLSIVRMLRAASVLVPVLFLTTLGGIEDRVAGLNAGGDDYLIKPFAFSELAARVAALGRRPRALAIQETVLKLADLELDLNACVVRRGGKTIDLQPREFRLLAYLMRHAGQIVTRTMLLEKVWRVHFDPHTNVVESHVSRLRSKLALDGRPDLIHTIRGSGYCLRAPT
ncbi:MAG: response regulator transcription factor [Proteobacteria bacterium]|nr:response regulator transcription factor [Pseudomonadota bacterium]